MAKKVLTIDIDANTSKLKASFTEIPPLIEKQVSSLSKLDQLEQERTKLLVEQHSLIAKVQATVAKVGNLSEKMQIGAVNASLASVNKTFVNIYENVKKISTEINTIKTRANLGLSAYAGTGPTRQVGTGASYFGNKPQQPTTPSYTGYGPLGGGTTINTSIAATVAQARAAADAQKAVFADLGKDIFKPQSDYALKMISGMSAAGRQALEQQKKVNAELDKSKDKVKDVAREHRNIVVHIGEIIGIYRVYNSLINTTVSSIQAIPKIGIELEATKAILTSTTGSESGMSAVLKALDKEAERTGISLASLRENFRLFQASTSLAGESLKDTWTMFTNINTVSTALHLTTDKTIGIFNALAQIFNKSKVQSEELVKQLGNLLPGAFASFQKANDKVYKSTQDLIYAMSQGTVFAHDTILNFTNFLKDRFAASFAVASTGLNANIGRMQTSFTHLGETIYNINSGPMNAVVKGITTLSNRFEEALRTGNSLTDTLQTIAAIISGSLVAALIRASAQAKILQGSLLSLGSTAILTGLTAVASKLALVGQTQGAIYDEARERLEAFKAEQTKLDQAKPIQIRVEASNEVVKARKDLEDLQKELAAVRKSEASTRYAGSQGVISKQAAESELVQNIKNQQELIKKTIEAQTIAIKKADQDSLNNIVTGGVDLTHEIGQIHEDALKAQGKDIEAALANWDNQYKAKVEAAKKSIEKAKATLASGVTDEDVISNLKATISKMETFVQESELARQGAAASARKKDTKEAIKSETDKIAVLKTLTASEIAQTNSALSVQQTAYKNNQIFFEEYFANRLRIITDAYNKEKALLEQQEAVAAKTGKESLRVQAQEKLKEITADYQAKTQEIDSDKAAALQDYTNLLNAVHTNYLNILGIEQNMTDELNKQYTAEKQKLELAARSPIADVANKAKNALQEQQITKTNIILLDEYKKRQVEIRNIQEDYSNKINRVNILKNVGAVSDLTAARMIQKANEEEIAHLEEKIRLNEQLLTQNAGTPIADRLKRDIAQSREELENLKLQAGTVSAYFENVLGASFERAFTGFATGAMTAKQAFASFATGIVEEIAKIAAQEARSAIVGGLFKMGLSAVGSFFGGGFQGNGPLLSYQNPFASGGVASGLDNVSGTVLTKPTVFPNAKVIPFASGGVLAGEAGAEAVLPLKRGKGGKLGVAVENNGQSGGNVYNISVSVEKGTGETNEAYAAKIAEAIAKRVAKEEIANASRPGNINNRVTKFG